MWRRWTMQATTFCTLWRARRRRWAGWAWLGCFEAPWELGWTVQSGGWVCASLLLGGVLATGLKRSVAAFLGPRRGQRDSVVCLPPHPAGGSAVHSSGEPRLRGGAPGRCLPATSLLLSLGKRLARRGVVMLQVLPCMCRCWKSGGQQDNWAVHVTTDSWYHRPTYRFPCCVLLRGAGASCTFLPTTLPAA